MFKFMRWCECPRALPGQAPNIIRWLPVTSQAYLSMRCMDASLCTEC